MSVKTRHELDDERDERIIEIMEKYAPVFEAYFAEQRKRVEEIHEKRLLEVEKTLRMGRNC